MSNLNQHFFQQEYNSWGEALDAYIVWKHGQKRGSRKWLAKKLLGEDAPDNKITSKSSEIGRWINEGVTPIERTQEEINNKINGCLYRNEQGLWKISRTKGEEYMEKYTRGVDEEPPKGDPLTQKLDRIESVANEQGVSDSDRAVLLEYLQGRAESLSKELQDLAAGLRKLQNLDEDTD